MRHDDSLAAHAALVAALRDPAAYAHPVATVELIDTHISSVLLAGDYAYKLKKPVDLGFVDFTTRARRRHFCEEEIRLNRRSAPGIYLDVVAIGGSPPRFLSAAAVDDERAIDFAVRMRRFAADARLDERARAGTLDGELVDRLAAALAAFHARCERVAGASRYGTAETIRRWALDNFADLRRLATDAAQLQRIDRLALWTELEFARRAPHFTARHASGFVRDCHGDLHLGNLVLIDGEPLPFDCIEFNAELRCIDVMSDLAFTYMDLADYGLPRLAARLVNGYLQASGDYAGLAGLRFYAVYRALVRAKVALIRRDQPGAAQAVRAREEQTFARYLSVAEALAVAAAPRLIATCGVTGSGKTTVARYLLEALGAVLVRADVERKRLAGIAATTHRPAEVGAGLYDAQSTRRTYERLAEAATAIVDAGFAAILDATFQRRSDRGSVRDLAQQLGAELAFVFCDAPAATLRARVAARAADGRDASDATLDVLTHQLAAFEPPAAGEGFAVLRIDTDCDADTLAARSEALAASLGSSACA